MTIWVLVVYLVSTLRLLSFMLVMDTSGLLKTRKGSDSRWNPVKSTSWDSKL